MQWPYNALKAIKRTSRAFGALQGPPLTQALKTFMKALIRTSNQCIERP